MRVNHVGEICAQALYQGQAMTAHNPDVQHTLAQAAREETEHLAWTERRIAELSGRKSVLNPLWYGGSFAIGALAGMLGDKWNLGFLAETERQVEAHLAGHLKAAPTSRRKKPRHSRTNADRRSRARSTAMAHGGVELPAPVKLVMKLGSNVMTRTAYWV